MPARSGYMGIYLETVVELSQEQHLWKAYVN